MTDTQGKSAYFSESVDPLVFDNKYFFIKAEHYQRYEFAADFIKKNNINDNVVYDIGCGNGYGARLMADHARHTYGFDRNDDFLDYARNAWLNNETITYIKLDLEQSSLVDIVKKENLEKPNLIICFETLEHISNPQEVLKSFNNVLSAGGYLICSTPNEKYEPKKKGKSKVKFHKQVFSESRLRSIINDAGFIIEGLYGQPFTNIFIHRMRKYVKLLDKYCLSSLCKFKLYSRLFAYPRKFLSGKSYSMIFVCKKG